jgi:hypothetical protein
MEAVGNKIRLNSQGWEDTPRLLTGPVAAALILGNDRLPIFELELRPQLYHQQQLEALSALRRA